MFLSAVVRNCNPGSFSSIPVSPIEESVIQILLQYHGYPFYPEDLVTAVTHM